MNQSPVNNYSLRAIQQTESFMSDTLAKAQLRRHLSTSSQQKRLSRISKPSSAGNSPQDTQKRRHLSSQAIPRQRQAYYQQCLQNPSASHVHTSRPFSWHPSTMVDQGIPVYAANFSYGIPTPQPNSVTHLEPKRYYNSEDPSGFYQQSADYDVQENVNVNSMMQGAYSNIIYQQETSAVFSPIIYSNSITPGSFQMYNTPTAPPTPDFYTITHTSEVSHSTLLPRSDSKELVGMGLYDGPDRNSWTLDNYMEYDHSTTRPLSLGKGLKLEETWEPPEDEDKTDDEDEDEEDSHGQAEETIQQQLEQVAREAPRLPSLDATNQSFFYNPQTITSSQVGLAQHMTMAPYGIVL